MTAPKPAATAKPAAKPAAKSAAKPAPKTAAKPAPKPAAKPVVAAAVTPQAAMPVEVPVVAAAKTKPANVKATSVLKLKDLVDQVVKATGGKKKGVKEIVVATLASLGNALTKGEDLNLPPLGKAKVGRQKDQAEGELLVVKLRRGGGGGADRKAAKEALAAAEDNG